MVVLRFAVGAALTVAVFAVAVFVAHALRSENPSAFGRRGQKAWSTKAYLGLALVGWIAVVAGGVHGVLNLAFGEWPDACWTVALAAAFGSLNVAAHLYDLPRQRMDFSVQSGTIVWLQQNIAGLRPTDADIERTLGQSKDVSKSLVERQSLDRQHDIMVALKKRDSALESAFAYRQQREREARAEAEAKASREASLAAAEREQKQRAQTLIDARASHLPIVQSVDQVDGVSLVAPALLMRLWQEFEQSVVTPVPNLQMGPEQVTGQLVARLQALSGVSVPEGVRPQIAFHGTERDGFCDAVALEPGGTVPLYQRLSFEHSLNGLTTAFFFAAALPRRWSWGHGFYDRDAVLLVKPEHLTASLRGFGTEQPKDVVRWPPVGVRLRLVDGGIEVACLAAREGRGLYDLSIEVRCGKASSLRTRDVFVWGQGVFY